MSGQAVSIKGSTQQSLTSGPKLRGGYRLFSKGDPLITDTVL